MNERPILFSGEMVRAILEGRKTQTRRVIKANKKTAWLINGDWADSYIKDPGNYLVEACPFGRPGDRLWVRETFCPVDDTSMGGEKWIDYRATPKYESSHPAGWENAPDDEDALKWKPSIHMPRWASRITLEIVNVRVEKLQEITFEDVKAEGTFEWGSDKVRDGVWDGRKRGIPYPMNGFAEMWNSLNAKRGYSWESNPWVWVIEFKKVEK